MESVVAFFRMLFRHEPGKNEENKENLESTPDDAG
jgi:hypothetical protein